ncbi:DUF302 domain-containing protein [Suttonella ornithocola]|uniref:Uncharacterized conserved protein n=1 Tax=Suttonella ornithocola TaxID=279832 RepID=A0A380N0L3_9GAMM|nr:DUF302 domain-containing protein [Suttonella ornithocola]SUO97287.1 Uncharacterized conserved protein [Suttonella ornithocola]
MVLKTILLSMGLLAMKVVLAAESLVKVESPDNFETTFQRVEQGLKDKGMTIFTVVDHADAAKENGLTLRPTRVIIFGNPKGGTPLMEKAPSLALQLPLKVLIFEGDDGKVYGEFLTAKALAEGVGVNVEVVESLAPAEKLLQKLVSGQ